MILASEPVKLQRNGCSESEKMAVSERGPWEELCTVEPMEIGDERGGEGR